MINWLKQLFTISRASIEQRESETTPGQWDLFRVEMRFNSWKLGVMFAMCSAMGATMAMIAAWYLLLIVSMH